MTINRATKCILGCILLCALIVTPIVADSETDYIKRTMEKSYVKPMKYENISGDTPEEIRSMR